MFQPVSVVLEQLWFDMQKRSDGWNWYWLSYGEKDYAFAVVTAFPVDDAIADDESKWPPAGGRLEMHEEKERVWVAEDGTEMLTDDWLVTVERQCGDVICRFIAGAFADAKRRFAFARSPTNTVTETA